MRTFPIRLTLAAENSAIPTLAVLALTSLICGCSEKPAAAPFVPAAPPQVSAAEAPGEGHARVQILDFAGIEQLIASHRGQVVVLDAWSTSCVPCVKEFPKLVALHARYSPEQLACISLSFDFEGIGTPQEQVPRVLKFLERQGATFENVVSSEESDVLYRKFKLASVPAVFVYDRSGQLRKRFDNEAAAREADAFTYEQVGQLVAELVAEDAGQAPVTTAEEAPAN